jgi:dolichol-phosphate mannosyltransferase
MLSYSLIHCTENGDMRQALKFDFIRFCIVGSLGFIINFSLLTLLYKVFEINIFISQLIAAEISLFNNFLLHHKWTYKRNNVVKNLKDLLWQFHVTSWVAIIGSALLVSLFASVLGMHYFLSLVISSSIALSWNFFWTKYVVWKHHHANE